MKLEEMGVFGHEAKLSADAPSHAGEIGIIITMSTERAYIEFKDGSKEWVANKYIVGTRKKVANEQHTDFDDYPLTEMAAKKLCNKCGKTMAANHYWYKGGWKCKKGGSDVSADAQKSKTRSEARTDDDKFPEMDDENYDKLSAADKAKQDAREQEYFKRHGRTGPKDYTPRDANEKAAWNRAVKLRDELEKRAAKK